MGGRLRLTIIAPAAGSASRGIFPSQKIRGLTRRLLHPQRGACDMYPPPPFKPDRTASLAFAGLRGFGLFCASDGRKPVASLAPFYLSYAADGTPQAAFHVARHNPLAGLADGSSPWLLAIA